MRPPAAWPGHAPANQPARPFSRLRREGRPAVGRRRLSHGFRACRRERALWRAPCPTCEPIMRPPGAWADRFAPARSTRALRMFHVKHSFVSERIEAACSLLRSPRRSTVVEYAHAFCEGTYRHRRTLAFRAGRCGCVPRLRAARFRMPRTVCPAAHGGSAGRRSLPRPSLLFLSIPLAHGFARGAATCRNLARRARSRQGHVRHCAGSFPARCFT